MRSVDVGAQVSDRSVWSGWSDAMLAEIPITFEHPMLLLVAILIVPVVLLARMGAAGQTARKLWFSVVFRSLLLVLLAVALSRPSFVERGESLTLMVVADRSRSIPRELARTGERFLARVEEAKRETEDRIGVVTVAEASEIRQTPDPNARIKLDHAGDLAATNLADAIRTAVSLMPSDTANRILLVSDGNETESNVLEAIELARANSIPVDVLPIEYQYDSEIVFEQLKAPARVRLGQSVDLRAFIDSKHETTGRLRVFQNGAELDLDPGGEGRSRSISLVPGTNALSIPVSMDQAGAQKFEAVFEPDEASHDVLEENNRYEAVTFVGGEGRILVVTETPREQERFLQALRAGGLDTIVESPSVLAEGPAFLNGFDSVILANVPRWNIDTTADRALRSYVHDLGGGLLMLGGDRSFGAGGWIDSETAEVLPVRLDPPQERQMTRGALALIMHSCEMPRGNYWGQKTAIAAIDALSSLDYVGIVTFAFGGGGVNGCSWTFPMQLAGDKTAAIAAAKSMVIGDMPDFMGSMQLALAGLQGVSAGQRHVIVISDGDPSPPPRSLLDDYVTAGVSITTVMVGGHGTPSDARNMQGVAEYTGGTFYKIDNPKLLPKIFIKEATLVTRTLIQEGRFPVEATPSLDGPTRGLGGVPEVDGFVLTVAREGLAKTPLQIESEDGIDPLLAYWNHGLGKAVAFTSDVGSRWSASWLGWSIYQTFWEQIVRWTMRPATPSTLAIRAGVDDEGRGVVEVEALEIAGGFDDFLKGEARVLRPDGSSAPVALQQIGPGRYRTEFPIENEGSYLVNAVLVDASGESVSSVQAAVSVPYRPEFATTRDNRALLESVAARTGGRVFDPEEDLLVSDPFDRAGLEMPSSPTRIWDIVVVLAAGLFVIDVAVRRLSIERRRIANRGVKGDGTVQAWKRARRRATRRDDAAGSVDRGRKVEVDEAGPRFDVTENLASTDSISPRPSSPSPGASGIGDSASDSADEDMTSRLLRAKRRAGTDREEDDG